MPCTGREIGTQAPCAHLGPRRVRALGGAGALRVLFPAVSSLQPDGALPQHRPLCRPCAFGSGGLPAVPPRAPVPAMPPMSPYSPGPALPGRPRVLSRRCVPAPPRPQHPPKAPDGHCAPRPLPAPTSSSASQPPGALRPQAAPPPRAGAPVGTCSALLLVPHPPVSPGAPGSRRRGALRAPGVRTGSRDTAD